MSGVGTESNQAGPQPGGHDGRGSDNQHGPDPMQTASGNGVGDVKRALAPFWGPRERGAHPLTNGPTTVPTRRGNAKAKPRNEVQRWGGSRLSLDESAQTHTSTSSGH